MSSSKKGRPRKSLDYRRQARQESALVRRKSELAAWRLANVSSNDLLLEPFYKGKIAAAERDIAGLEAKLGGVL